METDLYAVFWDSANAFGSLSQNLRWEALRFLNNLVKTYEMPWEDTVHECSVQAGGGGAGRYVSLD